ncbi:DinB family protein [Paenibacillus sp. sptzw28]|uniref:DinB family protein n=1 Tax=Paenibacillus sp. sptzw28 TaxID=715179 RepID=UPI001C6E153D|nr:DinB family protein [Paenibacillus sp. sptzw28]QYR23017.1 DinB family protein [Paenibacillus sp. sptzw28]
MIHLFQYNWMVRDEWFELCKRIPGEELLRRRIGGAGSILYTLFHIADVEYSWVRGIQGKPDVQVSFEDYKSIPQVRELSDSWKAETASFVQTWTEKLEQELVSVPWSDGRYSKGEILRHVIAHEIHHMGQLSVWVRELGFQPVSANFIGRGLQR